MGIAEPWVVWAHLACTLFMVGLIWLIQIVHYPLFAMVDESSFTAYQVAHVRRITWVVLPVMLCELVSSAMLVTMPLPGAWMRVAWVNLVLLGLIWASTAFLQVPLHQRLESGFDAQTHHWLVQSNWIRTLLWTGRGVLACVFTHGLLTLERTS